MDKKDIVKIIISVSIFLVFGGLSALLMLVNINLGFTEFSSIEGVIEKREELIELEEKLNDAELDYASRKNELVVAKTNFEKAKNKYESISDKTIDLIKEATTEENYDIEYMWIKLGNYALVNNLSIIMVEPGGSMTTVKQTANNGNQTSTTGSTTSASANTTNTTSTENTNQTDNANSTANSESTTDSAADSILTVTVEGSYLNMADFVFEVENDKELRFKLDNIEITCVTGTTIKAKFNVKNVIVIK